MFRKVFAALALVLVVACVSAKEYKGTVTKIDTEKKTLTVKVDDAEKTFVYTDSTEFTGGKGGKSIPADGLSKLADRVASKARPATVVTEEKDGKEVLKDGNPVASKVQLAGRGKGSKAQ